MSTQLAAPAGHRPAHRDDRWPWPPARAWASPPGAATLGLQFVPVLLAFAAVGWLIAGHRARNPIGWLFLIEGLAFAIAVATAKYARFAAVDRRSASGRAVGGLGRRYHR